MSWATSRQGLRAREESLLLSFISSDCRFSFSSLLCWDISDNVMLPTCICIWHGHRMHFIRSHRAGVAIDRLLERIRLCSCRLLSILDLVGWWLRNRDLRQSYDIGLFRTGYLRDVNWSHLCLERNLYEHIWMRNEMCCIVAIHQQSLCFWIKYVCTLIWVNVHHYGFTICR